ncbi:MAG: 4Fe-4S binding protein [Dehalococcoidales bacterium]|nr:4Fe-4S binding protein [Dehalococcoidales bacterium]
MVVASTSGSGLVAAAAESGPPELKGWALLYNTMLCQGPNCRACTAGCRDWNKLNEPDPSESSSKNEGLATNSWTVINDQAVVSSGGTKTTHHFVMAQCRHCTTASCVAACPTGAMAYRGDYTVVDQKWCIGCGNCAQACPFGVPQLGEPKATSTKCHFCYNLLQNNNPDTQWLDPETMTDPVIKGKSTACALRCPVRPVKALRFGKRDTLIAAAKIEVEALKNGQNPYTNTKLKAPLPDVHLYGDSEAISGGSHVLFILEQKSSFYGIKDLPGLNPNQIFPDQVKVSASKVTASWGTGVSTSAALAILPFWLLFRRKQQMEAGQKSGVQGSAK